jgi:hypothetical protein
MLVVLMTMMQIREMGMAVDERRMTVPVRVGLTNGIVRPVFMLVMFVMGVGVIKQHRPLEHIGVSMGGLAQSVEKAFNGVAHEREVEVLAALLRTGQEPRPHRLIWRGGFMHWPPNKGE